MNMKISPRLVRLGRTKINPLLFTLILFFTIPLFSNASDYNINLLSREDLEFSIITAAGPGGGPHIRAFNQDGEVNTTPNKLFAYGEDFRKGVYVTTGDVDADGLDEIITAPRAGGGPQVRIFEKDGTRKSIEIWPYDSNLKTGFSIASGDIDADNKDEIAVVPAEKNEALVKIYRYNAEKEVVGEWNAFGKVKCGASVAMSDIDNDGKDEVITGAGPTGGPQVRIFETDGKLLKQFFAFEESYRGGLDVAAGDTDGDGLKKEIVVSKKRESAEIKVFQIGNEIKTLASFRAFDNFKVGAFVEASDIDEDNQDEILVGAGEGGGPQIELYEGNGNKINTTFFAYNKNFHGGIDVTSGLFNLKEGIPYTFSGAGDIARCGVDGDEETAKLLDNISGTIFTAGDNAYDHGSDEEFQNCYEPTWGRHKSRTKPTLGNHEYYTVNALGHFRYFGEAAGDPDKGYYSYDLGPWHMIALNSNCSKIGGCETSSLQEQWLQSDLAANVSDCTLAYMHHPLFSSGPHGDNIFMQDIWQALYNTSTDIVVAGHDHFYERFSPQDPDGDLNLQNGILEFIVGTGGTHNLYDFINIKENSIARYNDSQGIIKFTLYSKSYEWEYIPIAGFDFSDKGSGWCH